MRLQILSIWDSNPFFSVPLPFDWNRIHARVLQKTKGRSSSAFVFLVTSMRSLRNPITFGVYSEARGTKREVEMAFPTRKLRILSLHSFRTSAAIFKEQVVAIPPPLNPRTVA